MPERDIVEVLSDMEAPISRIKTMAGIMLDLSAPADSRVSGEKVGELASIIYEAADKLQALFGEGWDLARPTRLPAPPKREA